MLSSSEVSLDPVAPLSTGDLISTVSLFTCQTALKNFPSLDTSTVLLPTTVTSNKNDVTLSPSTFTKSAESFIHEKQTAGNSSCFNRCTQSRVNAATLTKKNTYSKPTKHRHKSQKNSLGHPSPPSITHSQRDTSVTLNLPSSSDQHASILSSYSNGGKDPFFKSDPLQPSLNETMDLDSTGTSLHAYSLPPLRNSLGVSSPNEHGISFKECMTTPFSSTDLQTSFHLDHFHDFKNHPFAESSSSSISLDDDDRGMKSFLPSCWFQEISNHPFTSPFSTVTSTGAMTLESLEKYPYSSGNEHWIQSLLDDPEANLTQSLSLITSEHALSEFPVLPNHSTSKCKDIVSCYSSCAMKITPKSLSYLGTSNTIEHTPLNEATESSILCPSPAPDTKSNPPATTLSNEESVLIKSLTSYIHFSPCKSIKDKELDKCTSESIVDQADLVVPLNALSSTTHATLQSKPNFIEHGILFTSLHFNLQSLFKQKKRKK
ncbi:hypothetical protein HMI54_015755 [Coelomomyces lativittatus]|nr:hypothetical protein HMI54_015755 [Coelomomyces lativittatus]